MENSENNPVQESVAVSNPLKKNGTTIIIALIMLALGFILGIGIAKIISQKEAIKQPNNIYKASSLKAADPTTLIDPTQILQHPVFTEWLGSVEGVLVEKSSDSFTIEKGGKKLPIYLQEGLTGFYGKAVNVGKALPKITLKEIPIGAYLRGGVTITRLSLKDKADRHIFANIFTIVDNEPTKSQ